METSHRIKWNEAKVISMEPHLTKRKVKEALIIRNPNNLYLLDSGFQLDCMCVVPGISALNISPSHLNSPHLSHHL